MPAANPPNTKEHRMKKRLICALLCVCLLSGTFLGALADQPRPIEPLDYDSLPAAKDGQHHYLMACVDTWETKPTNLGNTDGVILVTLDTRAKRILFTTFTREMLIQRPDGVTGRITYIAKTYGPEELCRIISTHFGVKVDRFILFSMDNVQTIIDAMGGVNIEVTNAEADYLNRYRIARDATTPSMDKAGTYLFTGHAAVIYMRIRKVGNEGDAGRTRRMRTVLSTLTQQFETINLDQALQILSAVTSNTCITNMTMPNLLEALGYAMDLRGVAPEGIQMPPNDCMEPILYAGMTTRQVDFARAREKLSEFLDDDFVVVDE